MQLQLDESLRARIAGVTFGMVTIRGVTVSERNEQRRIVCEFHNN